MASVSLKDGRVAGGVGPKPEEWVEWGDETCERRPPPPLWLLGAVEELRLPPPPPPPENELNDEGEKAV